MTRPPKSLHKSGWVDQIPKREGSKSALKLDGQPFKLAELAAGKEIFQSAFFFVFFFSSPPPNTHFTCNAVEGFLKPADGVKAHWGAI